MIMERTFSRLNQPNFHPILEMQRSDNKMNKTKHIIFAAMKSYRVLILWISIFLLAGCSTRQTGAQASLPQADTLSVPDTVFAAMPIPAEVEARMRGVTWPEGAEIALDDLRYLRLTYCDFEGRTRTGEMVCNKLIASDLIDIFRALYQARYPIRSIRLADDFGGSDEASMEADNTSCFNYRLRPGQRILSKHALGLAVDINLWRIRMSGMGKCSLPAPNPSRTGKKISPTRSIPRTCATACSASGASTGAAAGRSTKTTSTSRNKPKKSSPRRLLFFWIGRA